MLVRGIMLAALLAAAIAGGPVRAEEEMWPSEAEERLEQVEADLVDLQVKLAVARLNDKKDDVEKLGKQFDEIQKERLKLLRDTGQINF
jgi:type II secretory pathway component PulK